jgi:hypothetical protein
VAAILNDLVSSGLAYSTGRAGSAVFGLTSAVDRERMADEDQRTTLPAMAWLIIYREGPLTTAGLQERLGIGTTELRAMLHELEQEGRVQRDADDRYRSSTITIAVGDRVGWEAAVLDHFQGVAKAIAAKIRLGPQSELRDVIGGATLSFDVHSGHPLEAEVYDLLRGMRAQVNELWGRLSAHNRAHPIADADKVKVTFYLGQNVERPEEGSGGSPPSSDARHQDEPTAEAADADAAEDTAADADAAEAASADADAGDDTSDLADDKTRAADEGSVEPDEAQEGER